MNDYYGYEPYTGYMGGYDSRYVTYTDGAHELPEGGATDWGSHDNPKVMIEEMWTMLAGDNPSKASYLAHSWWRLSELLGITAGNLRRHVDNLAANWSSPVAKGDFLRVMGTSLYSIDQWKERASNNYVYLSSVAYQLDTTKRNVKRIYTEYVNEMNHQNQRKADDAGVQGSEVVTLGFGGPDSWSDDEFDDYKKQKTTEARKYMVDLGNAFTEGYVSQGDQYKGPTNAKVVNPEDYMPAPPVSGPGGTRPSRPASPTNGPRPPAPNAPQSFLQATVTNPPTTPPPATPGPTLQNGVITPPAPPPTTPGVPPPAPNVTGTPPAPVPPGATGPLGPRGAPPATPTTNNMSNRGGQPPRPTTGTPPGGGRPKSPSLQGRNAGARPPALPPNSGSRAGGKPGTPPSARPTAGGRPGAPGLPPGGRAGGRPGAPTARPSTPPVIGKRGAGGPNAAGRPGMPGTPPGGRGGQPPVLGKRTAGKPGTPTAGKPGVPGMSTGKPGVPGMPSGRPGQPGAPGAPGGGRTPSLGGRSGPQRKGDTGDGASRAVRKDLSGRGTGPGSGSGSPSLSGRSGPEARRRMQQQKRLAAEPWEHDPYADEELWTVDTPGGGVIDQQNTQQHPENPGPALGR